MLRDELHCGSFREVPERTILDTNAIREKQNTAFVFSEAFENHYQEEEVPASQCGIVNRLRCRYAFLLSFSLELSFVVDYFRFEQLVHSGQSYNVTKGSRRRERVGDPEAYPSGTLGKAHYLV